ncbi:MAG: hypothetical protein NVS2B14_00050 [Chamaesiphon sp.]
MKIQLIGYGTTKGIGNFENIKIYSEAVVEEGETPEEALQKLREWVNSKCPDYDKTRDLEYRRHNAEQELSRIESELDRKTNLAREQWGRLEDIWNKAIAFLKVQGLEHTTFQLHFPQRPSFLVEEPPAFDENVAVMLNEEEEDFEDEDDY